MRRDLTTRPMAPAELDAFVEVAWPCNAADSSWVPPLRDVVKRDLLGGAFARYGRVQPFLCFDGGRAIGRIAALVNPRLVEDGRPIGQLGFFEAPDDVEVAGSLVEAGLAWLREQGARRVVGPMNGGAHRTHRFLVRGFETPPHLFEPRNPPWYPRLFEAHGFRRIHSWFGYELDRDAALRVRALLSAGARRAARQGQRVVLLEPRDPASLARVHRLLDLTWAGHVGYSPLDLEEFVEVFGGALTLMTERNLGLVVDGEGKDLGLAFTFPDWSDEVRKLDGDAAGWGRWLGSAPHPKRHVYHTVAFIAEARRTGAPFLLMDRGLEHALEDGYETLAVALVTEEFKIFEGIAPLVREYALYGREA